MFEAISICIAITTHARLAVQSVLKAKRLLQLWVASLAIFAACAVSAGEREVVDVESFNLPAAQLVNNSDKGGMALWMDSARKVAVSAFSKREVGGSVGGFGFASANDSVETFRSNVKQDRSRVFGLRLSYKF